MTLEEFIIQNENILSNYFDTARMTLIKPEEASTMDEYLTNMCNYIATKQFMTYYENFFKNLVNLPIQEFLGDSKAYEKSEMRVVKLVQVLTITNVKNWSRIFEEYQLKTQNTYADIIIKYFIMYCYIRNILYGSQSNEQYVYYIVEKSKLLLIFNILAQPNKVGMNSLVDGG